MKYVPPTLPAPTCTVLQDPPGDANPLGSTSNVDSLDILAAGFAPNSKDITAQLLVKSLNDGPGGTTQLAGDGDNWYVKWTYNKTEYFLSAQYPVNSPNTGSPTSLFSFSYGTVTKSPTNGDFYNTVGAATGKVDTAHGIITMSAPLANFGSPASGAALTQTGAITFESVGTPAGGLLETADTAGPGSDYSIGTSC